jgi:hypothetical protein
MNELNDMTCAELADVAAELALGVLTGRERAVAIAHLNTCDVCREDVRQLMATGEQLRELLPSAEPPAGFETRVLKRLGLPVPAGQDGQPSQPGQPGQPSRYGQTSEYGQPSQYGQPGRPDHDDKHDDKEDPRERAVQDTQRTLGRAPDRAQGPRHRAGRGTTRPGTGHSAPPAGPGATGRPARPGRMRRMLSAAAVVLAVVVAGLGGWRIGEVAEPETTPLSSATLVSTTNASQHVGQVFLYSGEPAWLYMAVDLGSGNGIVTCQVVGADGRVTTIGSFRLADGYGAWGSPDPGVPGQVTGARLVSATGTVIATGTFAPT